MIPGRWWGVSPQPWKGKDNPRESRRKCQSFIISLKPLDDCCLLPLDPAIPPVTTHARAKEGLEANSPQNLMGPNPGQLFLGTYD